MLSGTVLKQFRTYLKSQVGHGWSVEGRKSKGRLLTRVSFRYLSGERSVVLLDIDFDAEYQDDIVRTIRKLSDLMRKKILNYQKQKNYFVVGKLMIRVKLLLTGNHYKMSLLMWKEGIEERQLLLV